MARYGNYYGNLGAAQTGFSDETPDAQALPLGVSSLAPARGASYAGSIAVGKPRVNSFDNDNGGQGGVSRDAFVAQKGKRAAQQDYEAVVASMPVNRGRENGRYEEDTYYGDPIVGRYPDEAAKARNLVDYRFNTLAETLDKYNAELSNSLYGASFGDARLQSAGSTPPGVNQAFGPRNVTDRDGVQTQTRNALLEQLNSLTPEEFAAASPEFKIWADHFRTSNTGTDWSNYGTAGLQKYMQRLTSAGVMNPKYVGQYGSKYDGTAVVNDDSRVGSNYNWSAIDRTMRDGFLPNPGLSYDNNLSYKPDSVYPQIANIQSQAMYNPFTNSPVEHMKNGLTIVDQSTTSPFPGFQWGQGLFSTPPAPYYSTGYGDRFKADPAGNGPAQWAKRPGDFSALEGRDYEPEGTLEIEKAQLVGQAPFPVVPETLSSGGREVFSRAPRQEQARVERYRETVPINPLYSRPTLTGEKTVSLGNIGAGYGSYRLLEQESAKAGDNIYGISDLGNSYGQQVGSGYYGRVWDTPGVPNAIDPANRFYVQNGNNGTTSVRLRASRQQVGEIGANLDNVKYLSEGFR